MFLTIRLDRTLEMMQNDVETSKFEYRKHGDLVIFG